MRKLNAYLVDIICSRAVQKLMYTKIRKISARLKRACVCYSCAYLKVPSITYNLLICKINLINLINLLVLNIYTVLIR